jgi:hypothetical protein
MPKTATGKVQRRLVAKAMIDNEKKASDKTESTVPKAPESVGSESGFGLLSVFPRWIVNFSMRFFGGRK